MLSDKALLITLTLSQWSGRRYDRVATNTVHSTHETAAQVGNYNKKLLPNAVELEKVHSMGGALRKFVTERTLPWLSDGTRIVSGAYYLEFIRELNSRKDELDRAVRTFISAYPKLQVEAQSKLGTLYCASDYPSQDELARMFRCKVTVMPVPSSGDFRVELDQNEIDEFNSKMREVEANALKDAYSRLSEVISKATARLSDKDAKFKDSLIENVKDLVAIMPHLNIMDDHQLTALTTEVDQVIGKVDAEVMRNNLTDRETVANKLKAIESKMSVFMDAMGGSNE